MQKRRCFGSAFFVSRSAIATRDRQQSLHRLLISILPVSVSATIALPPCRINADLDTSCPITGQASARRALPPP